MKDKNICEDTIFVGHKLMQFSKKLSRYEICHENVIVSNVLLNRSKIIEANFLHRE